MSSNAEKLKNSIEERVIMRGLEEVKTKGIESYGKFYPIKYGFMLHEITNNTVYRYLDINNIERSVHIVVNIQDKDKYMKDKKYKFIGIIWKFIKSIEFKNDY
jgi:hypothetical protein